MARQIDAAGAGTYVARVDDRDPAWNHLLDRLATGDRQAIGLAARLRPYADAGNAEALDMAAAQALPRAPIEILAMTHHGAAIQSLCTSPFIEPADGVEKRYNRAALDALDRVPASGRPQPEFDACRSAIAAITKRL